MTGMTRDYHKTVGLSDPELVAQGSLVLQHVDSAAPTEYRYI